MFDARNDKKMLIQPQRGEGRTTKDNSEIGKSKKLKAISVGGQGQALPPNNSIFESY
jgi:hypothetical protein